MVTPVSPVVRKGSIRCYRFFDIGDEIDLQAASSLVQSASLRSTQVHRRGRSMEFIAVPVRVELGKRMIPVVLMGPPCEAEVELHLFSFGTVALCARFPLPERLELQSLALGHLFETLDLEALGRREIATILPSLRPAIRGAHEWSECETYTIVHLRELEPGTQPRELAAWPGLARLLLGETGSGPLAESNARQVTELAFSFYESDLVVIDWNSALLVDPRLDSGTAEILEFANCQLLNLRYHDERLEKEIRQLHDVLKRGRKGLFRSPYEKLAHELFRRLLDIQGRIDRIDNVIKVAGNMQLARVYQASLERLGVSSWRQSVERKHGLAASVYGMLNAETEHRRGLWLELTVVVLILVEIILALVAGH